MMEHSIFPAILNLFDGAAATAGGEAGAQGETQAQAAAPTRQGKKSGEYENVKFGKQPEETQEGSPAAGGETQKEAEVTVTSNTLEDKRKAFRDLVNGEYKDIFTEETQRIINRRFGETKILQKQVDDLQPLLGLLKQRYGLDTDDVGKLKEAIEGDNAYWAEAAEEAGMPLETYKQVQKIKAENEALKQTEANHARQAAIDQQLQRWVDEGESLKAKYPGFDLGVETGNPDFMKMIQSGVPMEHAYQVIHMDEIVSGAVQNAAQQAEKKVVDTIRAKGTRPAENGVSTSSAFTIKDDVSKLSKKDRAEVVRRAMLGERIEF